jgi:hypothetical protein
MQEQGAGAEPVHLLTHPRTKSNTDSVVIASADVLCTWGWRGSSLATWSYFVAFYNYIHIAVAIFQERGAGRMSPMGLPAPERVRGPRRNGRAVSRETS